MYQVITQLTENWRTPPAHSTINKNNLSPKVQYDRMGLSTIHQFLERKAGEFKLIDCYFYYILYYLY